MTDKRIIVLNGPNLNLLGKREPGVYGTMSLTDIENACTACARDLGYAVAFHQTNNEGDLVSWIQEAGLAGHPVILNAGAYSHTSIAIHDAIRASKAKVVEVHLSNVYAREAFRHHSHISPVARGVICGFGAGSYILAIRAIAADNDNN